MEISSKIGQLPLWWIWHDDGLCRPDLQGKSYDERSNASNSIFGPFFRGDDFGSVSGGVPLLTSGTPKVFCDIPVTGTEARTQIGTPYYLSPEVTSGVKGGSTSTFRKPPGKLESPKMGNIIFRFHVVSFLGE